MAEPPNAVRRALHVLPAVAVLAACVGAWEAWVRLRDTPDYVLPAPSQVWRAFVDQRGIVGGHLATTLLESALGLVVGAAAGIAVAVALAGSPLLRRVLGPIVVASQTIPVMVLAPLLVLGFGYGLTPKVVVVALVTFFPVAIATAGGLTGARPDHVELIASMGATNATTLTKVRVPSALPHLFDGLRIAAAYTVAGAVIAEYTGGSSGLGIYIDRSRAAFRVDQVFVAVAVIALVSTALFLIVGGLARVVCPWAYRRTES
mgnify:CR=1 FL=1